ncbi:RNA-binding protein EWS-like isoform X3 [Dromiciops gliroides]|uniref:RNA-binding protein EWS-like isoform X3 n=1 Tax=Dromiciops gliroides TaxID=33562 RepID=UPI001CC543D1|nr:RNA-binding protein EWS-like isoform X3 [Dromiciops gliroides]
MMSTDYSTYSQAEAQPAQGYAETTQAYGQQSYGTYGQPTDVSYTQAQTPATYWQTAYATFYGQPPTGYTIPTVPQAYSQPVQGYGTGAYDATTTTVTTTQASYAAQSAYGTQPACPTYGQQPATASPSRPQDGSKPAETSQPQSSTAGYSQPSLGYRQSNYSYPQVPSSYPMQPVTAPPSYLPTSYSSTQPTSYNQGSYSQQNTYGQQSSYGQQPPTSYPPQTGSYSLAPSQYSQQSSSYGQQSVFRQDHPSSMGVYGQESGGFSGPGENQSMSGPDNRGRGRGGFDHGGMSRGGRGGGGLGGMGSAGEPGGCNKPGGPMEEGPDLDLGPPVDPDEDSENSAIYEQGLNENVTADELADFFKQCGVVKMNKRTGQPMINIYLDKETGKPKGDATASYDDPPTAKAAVEWFGGKDFQGSKLKVSLARKKPPMNSVRGGRGGLMDHGGPGSMFRGGRGGDRGGFRGGRGMGRGGFGGRRRGGPLMEQMGGRRGGCGRPGKMDKREHRQEHRDRPY